MKLDPGIHIAMHSVLSLKPGVTNYQLFIAMHGRPSKNYLLQGTRHVLLEIKGVSYKNIILCRVTNFTEH